MRAAYFTLASLSLFAAMSESGAAAEVSCVKCNDYGVALYINGEIRAGDLTKIQSLISRFPVMSHDPSLSGAGVRLIAIKSTGGDVHEAIKIGRWIRKHAFSVVVERYCASACIFVLAAGTLRLIPPNTAIVIHRPYLLEMPSSAVKKNLQQAMQNILRLSKSYFAEMNIPENLADDMFSIDPAKGKKLSLREIAAYRLDHRT
jgi:hypothetical protein